MRVVRNALGILTMAIALTAFGGAAANAAPNATAQPFEIVTGIDAGGGPWLGSHNTGGQWRMGFLAFFDFGLGGLHVAGGDVDGDGRAEIVTGPGWGGRGELRVFDAQGLRKPLTALANPFGSGTQVAAGDVNGDGRADLIAGEDRGPNVRVFDGATGIRLSYFGAFQWPAGAAGVRVAAGDINGDGRAEVITAGGQPGSDARVDVFAGLQSNFLPPSLRTIRPFGPELRSGLHVAAADFTGDGRADIVVAGETADGPLVKVYDGIGGVVATRRAFDTIALGSLRVAAGDVDDDGEPDIVVAGDTPAGPLIRAFSLDWVPLFSVPGIDINESVAVADVDGDGRDEILASAGPGYEPRVAVLDARGVRATFGAYDSTFANGVRVATGDVDGDGDAEYIAGQGPGGWSELDVFDDEGQTMLSLHPFGPQATDGLYVAAGDVNGDRRADVVAGADAGGEPRVRVFDAAGRQLLSFLAFDASFRGGVRVAASDLDGDGRAEIVAGSGSGLGPASSSSSLVRVFDGKGALLRSFSAFGDFFTAGVYVAAGDLDGDGRAEIVVGAGAVAQSLVSVFDGRGTFQRTFRAYESEFTGGVRVAVGDVDRDAEGEIVTAPGRVRHVDVKVFEQNGREVSLFRANPNFEGGLFVAVRGPLGPSLEARGVEWRTTEGQTTTGTVATFSDPAGEALAEDYSATISWGDGTATRGDVSLLGSGRLVVSARKAYRRAGRYDITVRIVDRFLRGVVARTSATVDRTVLAAQGRTLEVRVGRPLQRLVAVVVTGNPKAVPRDFQTAISWGDGARSAGMMVKLGPRRFGVLGRHTYRRASRYVVTVDIKSAGGATARARTSVRVRA